MDARLCSELYLGIIQVLHQWLDQNTDRIGDSAIFERVQSEDQ